MRALSVTLPGGGDRPGRLTPNSRHGGTGLAHVLHAHAALALIQQQIGAVVLQGLSIVCNINLCKRELAKSYGPVELNDTGVIY